MKKMFDETKVEKLVAKSLSETDLDHIIAQDYEDRLNDSFDKLFKKLENMYEQADRNDSQLINIVMDFSQEHDNVFFEIGIMLGARLCKNFLHEPKAGFKDSIKNILKCGYNHNITNEDKKLLTTLFLERADRIIEKSLAEDKEYQDISHKSHQKLKELDKLELTKREWSLIDQAFSASNECGAEYGRVTYCQGFLDAMKLL